MPRLDPAAKWKYVPGGRFAIEERLGIPGVTAKRAPVTKYNDPARRFHLEQSLWKLKMREGQVFEESLWEEFMPVYEELLDMGRSELDEEALVFLVLNALPSSWSGFKEVLVSRGLDMVSLLEVIVGMAEAEEAELALDDGHEISRLGLDSGKMKDSVRDSGCQQCLSSHQVVNCLSSAMASNLSIRDANAEVAPSVVHKHGSPRTGNRNNNGEPKDEWVMGSRLTFVDANKRIAPRDVQGTRWQHQQQPQRSRNHGNKKNEFNQEATALGSRLSPKVPQGKPAHRSVQDTRSHSQGSRPLPGRKNEQPEEVWNGRSVPQAGTQRSQPQSSRMSGNRQDR